MPINIRKYFFQLLLMITLVSISFSQNNSNISFFEYSKQTALDDAQHIVKIGFGIIQAPFNFNNSDWTKVAYTGIITSSLFTTDQEAKEFALSNQTPYNDKIFKIDEYLNGGTGIYAGVGFYISGFLLKEKKIRMMGLHALETLYIANSITGFFKYTFGRRRPYGGQGQMDFKVFRGSEQKYRAFPSGHTTSAFAFASVMAMSVDNIYWKSFWYGSASMVGFARIYHNVHWISDTFLAAMISYNVADYVVHFDKEDNDEGFTIYPSFNGLRIRIYF